VTVTLTRQEYLEKQATAMHERGRWGLQERVRELCYAILPAIDQHFRFYHTWDSRKSSPGFPDCVIVIPGAGRQIFAELKRMGAGLTADQVKWLEALDRVPRNEVYLWRPIHYLDCSIEAVLRGTFEPKACGEWSP
jgi:hypothetical protein